ncbi:hypothetical protein SESBI_05711 [Sesbania bispinosa]|nr:hypothetical protein SESBI_05711 [Sesbania bispinosa]
MVENAGKGVEVVEEEGETDSDFDDSLSEGEVTMKEKLSKCPGEVMPNPRRRLDKEVSKSANWLATWVGGMKFEVTHTMQTDKFIVDIATHSCSFAALSYKGENPEFYVHKYYKRQAYEDCYGQPLTPINGQSLWPKIDDMPTSKVGVPVPPELLDANNTITNLLESSQHDHDVADIDLDAVIASLGDSDLTKSATPSTEPH